MHFLHKFSQCPIPHFTGLTRRVTHRSTEPGQLLADWPDGEHKRCYSSPASPYLASRLSHTTPAILARMNGMSSLSGQASSPWSKHTRQPRQGRMSMSHNEEKWSGWVNRVESSGQIQGAGRAREGEGAGGAGMTNEPRQRGNPKIAGQLEAH